MKKPKIDLSKQGMQKFMLYHVEKVILGVAIVLLGLFFWLGFSTESFSKQSPKGLAQLADRAHSAMVKSTSWDDIETYRQAKDDTANRIQELEQVSIPPSDYKYEYLTSVAAMTPGLRNDPLLIEAEHLMACTFPASVFLAIPQGDELARYPLAGAADMEEERRGRGRGDGIGSGGGMEGGGGFGPSTRDSAKKKPKDDGKIHPGDALPGHLELEMRGVRPAVAGVGPGAARSYLCNVTAVTGLVRVKDQEAEYISTFSTSQGYYPPRDRPIYRYLQIERQDKAMEGEDKWEDITDKVTVNQPFRYANATSEVVEPGYYDPVLTQPIPPMTQVDYRKFGTWPLCGQPLPDGFSIIPGRDLLAYPEGLLLTPDGGGNTTDDDFFGEGFGKPADNTFNDRRGNRGGGQRGNTGRGGARGGQRGGGAGGMPSGPPVGGPPSGRGGSRGGRGGARGGSGQPDQPKPARVGSDPAPYDAVAELKRFPAEYKLIRFFDIETLRSAKDMAKPAKQYRYRVRLWLFDPNNMTQEDMRLVDSTPGGGGRPGGRSSIGAGGGAAGGALDGGGPSGPGQRGGSGKDDNEDDEMENAIFVEVTEAMKEPIVRARIDRERERPPRMEWDPVARERFEREDLKKTRTTPPSAPSNWVTVEPPKNAEFYAGRVIPAKQTRIGDNIVAEGEPMANIAAMQWTPGFGTAVPANREARRSDLLNFQTTAHVLHPVDWAVREVKESPIKADAIVLDIIGGEEVKALNSSRSPIKYSMPAEVLVMSLDGTLHVQDSMKDSRNFNTALFQDDEVAEMGGKKKKKMDDDERGGGRGGRGGGRGDGRGDDNGPGF